MQIQSNNKATVRANLRNFMLENCDTDIQEAFLAHGYTLEPLVMQLIRELQALRHMGQKEKE
jgi:hypothetical protein